MTDSKLSRAMNMPLRCSWNFSTRSQKLMKFAKTCLRQLACLDLWLSVQLEKRQQTLPFLQLNLLSPRLRLFLQQLFLQLTFLRIFRRQVFLCLVFKCRLFQCRFRLQSLRPDLSSQQEWFHRWEFQTFGAPPSRLSAMPNPQMQQMQHTQQPTMDQTEIIFRARADNYRRDLNEIYSIPDLMKYMWNQGFDAIPPEDPPLLFNEVLKNREGALGASTLYQIICYGHPELETYYCAMCNHWTTCSEMFSHLAAPMHRMNFLSRNYKLFHQRAEGYTDLVERDKFLDLICKRVWKIDGSGPCVNRMRCILNIDAIKQVWPNYFEYVDNSWKMLGSNDGISGILEHPPASQLDEQPVSPNMQTEIHYPGLSLSKGKIQIKPSVNTVLSRGPIGEMERVDDRRESKERRRSRSRSRERSKKKSRGRRSRSNSRRRENRRRSRSRSHSPSPRRQNKDKKRDWDQKTAEFLNRIENEGISATLNSMSAASVNQVRDEFEANRAHLRRKETSDAEQERARLTRKALAVLVELQQLHDEKGSIKKSMIFAVAAEMGMTEEEVQNSKILKQGLETMQIVNDSTNEQQKQLSLEALGLDPSNLTKLLNSVSSKSDDVSMAYPEVDTDSKLASSIRTAIAETENKLRDPKNIHLYAELRQRLNYLQIKLSQELGVDPVKRVVPNPMARPRPMASVPVAKAPLPGAWRSMAARDAAPGAALRIRREKEERPVQREEHRFEASKVEAEWYQYYLKDPSKINELTDAVNKKEEAQYDNFYGPGTYVAFCAAKKRAAVNAKKALAANRLQSKPYFEDFTS
ncbi:Protein Y79H2A.3, isoform d [Aphelenchoides bicaudatus]|nr:Protein Y79H2A.3, isoform d [Aphelenchoides bicaudatus]